MRERDDDARAAAYRRLLRIEGEGSFIGLGDDAMSSGGRTRRQAIEYVAGITRWRRRLDFLLARYYHGAYADMELGLKIALRIGLYDLLYLRTPSYAAVNEAVRLARREIRRGAGGLVNGVLRSIIRDEDALPRPDSGDAADDLAVEHSHPTWLVRRWLDRRGHGATEELLRWNNARPVYGVRINMLKTDQESFTARLDAAGLTWETSRYLPHFVRTSGVQPLLEHGLLEEGLCAVQDESAGLTVALLDPQPGERIVDLCAAPGGKALYAAQRMENTGTIEAVDVHAGRLRLVERGARAHDVHIIRTTAADGRIFGKTCTNAADRVLVDAPCSGTGVMSKRADLRWRRRPEDLSDLVRLQDELLDAAASLVRPGGLLVYGTCSIEPEENEERIQAFLRRHAPFSLEHARESLPAEVVCEDGYYTSFPPRHQIDGAFGARLRKAS